jgi:very-short-patch-repair endonuclease
MEFKTRRLKLPYNSKLKDRANELRKAGVASEIMFWKQVHNKQFLGFDFDRQKIISNYIVDFYVKQLGIIIEIDGSSHDGRVEYDEIREAYLKGLGLDVIHINADAVEHNLDKIMQDFKKYIIENYKLSD